MEFRLTTMERRTQADLNFQNVQKGNLSALQFKAIYEAACNELYATGLAKEGTQEGEQALFMHYLRKIGPTARAEVSRDKRWYTYTDGRPAQFRPPETWKEAHAVLNESEQLAAGARSLVGSLSNADGSNSRKSRGGSGNPTAPPVAIE